MTSLPQSAQMNMQYIYIDNKKKFDQYTEAQKFLNAPRICVKL